MRKLYFVASIFCYLYRIVSLLSHLVGQFSRCDFVWRTPLPIQFMSSFPSFIPHFFRLSLDRPTPVHKRFSVLQTIHLLLCPGDKFSSTCYLLSISHNFCLAVRGLFSSCILGNSS